VADRVLVTHAVRQAAALRPDVVAIDASSSAGVISSMSSASTAATTTSTGHNARTNSSRPTAATRSRGTRPIAYSVGISSADSSMNTRPREFTNPTSSSGCCASTSLTTTSIGRTVTLDPPMDAPPVRPPRDGRPRRADRRGDVRATGVEGGALPSDRDWFGRPGLWQPGLAGTLQAQPSPPPAPRAEDTRSSPLPRQGRQERRTPP
jgi:hypothetical protein